MKKLLVVLAIGSFAACNGGSTTAASVDSAAKMATDSVKMVADSAKTSIDSTAKMAKDSIKAKVDSLKK